MAVLPFPLPPPPSPPQSLLLPPHNRPRLHTGVKRYSHVLPHLELEKKIHNMMVERTGGHLSLCPGSVCVCVFCGVFVCVCVCVCGCVCVCVCGLSATPLSHTQHTTKMCTGRRGEVMAFAQEVAEQAGVTDFRATYGWYSPLPPLSPPPSLTPPLQPLSWR